jgi:hypothetical protein
MNKLASLHTGKQGSERTEFENRMLLHIRARNKDDNGGLSNRDEPTISVFKWPRHMSHTERPVSTTNINLIF